MPRTPTDCQVFAVYSGKVVSLDYITESRRRFAVACMRVVDNAPRGWIVENGKVYAVSRDNRRARLAIDQAEARMKIVDELANPADAVALWPPVAV